MKQGLECKMCVCYMFYSCQCVVCITYYSVSMKAAETGRNVLNYSTSPVHKATKAPFDKLKEYMLCFYKYLVALHRTWTVARLCINADVI